jgi:pre-mRNA-splicing factor CWC22
MLATDAISWVVLECVNINEDDTTSSSRIFLKIMMQEMMESMGLKALAERFKDEQVRHATRNMFPMDNPKNTRFSINYFTSVGLGVLTEEMREYLKVCLTCQLEYCGGSRVFAIERSTSHYGTTTCHAGARIKLIQQ